MNQVKVKNMMLGDGIPKICVPIVGSTYEEIMEQAQKVKLSQPHLVEWRADFYERLEKAECVAQVCQELAGILGDIPLIFTVRTAGEGGNYKLSSKEYGELLVKAAKIPEIDLMDVELFMDQDAMIRLIKTIQKAGKLVIASNHHFSETPDQEEMEEILKQMENAGADIRKLAVMPQSSQDVLALLAATVEAKKAGKAPIITMSMGALGAVSRVTGELTGSAVTFASAGKASAPGQLDVETMRIVLEALKIR